MFENIYRHSVNDSRQPGAGQSTLAAQHLHLQPQDLQGTVCSSSKFAIQTVESNNFHLRPVGLSEIACQNYFVNTEILFLL